MKKYIWKIGGDTLSRISLNVPYWFTTNRDGEVELTPTQREGAVLVLSIAPVRQAIGVIFVPDQAVGLVALNGLLLASGLHRLRHADRLDVARKIFWISGTYTAQETEYDPAIHPHDAYCFLTKARLKGGDPIAICPGTQQTVCGALYGRAAWESVRQSPSPFCCPNCGFDPARPAWTPPVQHSVRSLDSLLQKTVGGSL